jgi:hypothetical protein
MTWDGSSQTVQPAAGTEQQVSIMAALSSYGNPKKGHLRSADTLSLDSLF